MSAVICCVVVTHPVAAGEALISFRYDVLPALSKQGCSSGACHGSPSGKGGFRLSLRGFDPDFDRLTLLREAFGRRVNLLEPRESLLLLKPTMRVAHGGGRQLRESDPAYGILRDWIERRCPDDPADAPRCVRIEVTPRQSEWHWPDNEGQLSVRAVFSDGSSRDVTRLAAFSSSDEKVAKVTAGGLVTAVQRGETAIMVRYLDFVETFDLRFLRPMAGFTWEAPTARNEIDELVFARLRKLEIPPSPVCTDSEFLRRVSLDLLGTLPSRASVKSFLADTSPDKRSRLIDHLLERPEHAEYWGQKWGDLLRVKGSKVSIAGVHKFHRWLVRAVADNMPYDQFARSLLTAQGSTFVNPPANYYRAAGGVNDAAEATSQLFLGIRIQCAKCHNHPFDRWSQDNYYGIGAFFARVQQTQLGKTGDAFVYVDRHGEVTQPRTGNVMRPWLPLTGPAEVSADQDRRAVFAEWLTSPGNPFFARAAVNRIWGQLFGRGIVEPVDDFRADNPPAHPDLLDVLARQFAADGFDQRALIRTILNSSVYQLSSRTVPLNEDDDKYFSHAYARLLSGEQLLDAVSHVTGVPEDFRGLPAGTRATGLPSPDFGNEFLRIFGQPARNTVCECERSDEPKLTQTLQMINGPVIPAKLRDRRGRLRQLLDDTPARIAAAGEPPRDGLVAWFKADAGVTGATGLAATDGDGVSRWENQAGDRLHCTQTNSDQQPQFVASAAGDLPAVRFDGHDDFLHNTQENVFETGSPRTVIVVGRLADDTGGALVTFRRGRQAGSSVFTAQYVQVSGSVYVYSDGLNGSGNTTVSATQLSDLKEPFVAVFLSQGAGGKLRVQLNGADALPVQPGTIGSDGGIPGFTIGSREDIPIQQQIWNGDISEVLIYERALADEQLREVGTYLTLRFDLATAYPRRPIPPLAGSDKTDAEILADFYYAAFSRPPSASELQFASQYIEQHSDRRQALEDLAWALMNSKEFVFQH